MCNKKEICIVKVIGDNTWGFNVRKCQHISDCKTEILTNKFPRHVCDCGINNNVCNIYVYRSPLSSLQIDITDTLFVIRRLVSRQ